MNNEGELVKLGKNLENAGKADGSRSTDVYRNLNEFKADFGRIYNQRDPRAYFTTLATLEYRIPEVACPVFRAVLEELRAVRGRERADVIDLGCSYGINAALLKRGVPMNELYAHYVNPALAGADSDTVAAQDERFFRQYPALENLRVTGLDVADNAVAYAERAGLVDRGVAADLESAPPAPGVNALLAGADAVISTGCVGYVTRTTFDRILKASEGGPPPWIASFVLRMFSYDDIAGTLASYGLVTEKLGGVLFPQRRFAGPEEKAQTLASLHDMDIDTAGLEDRHGYLAEFWLSRPQEEASARPLHHIVTSDDLPPDAVSLARPKP